MLALAPRKRGQLLLNSGVAEKRRVPSEIHPYLPHLHPSIRPSVGITLTVLSRRRLLDPLQAVIFILIQVITYWTTWLRRLLLQLQWTLYTMPRVVLIVDRHTRVLRPVAFITFHLRYQILPCFIRMTSSRSSPWIVISSHLWANYLHMQIDCRLLLRIRRWLQPYLLRLMNAKGKENVTRGSPPPPYLLNLEFRGGRFWLKNNWTPQIWHWNFISSTILTSTGNFFWSSENRKAHWVYCLK